MTTKTILISFILPVLYLLTCLQPVISASDNATARGSGISSNDMIRIIGKRAIGIRTFENPPSYPDSPIGSEITGLIESRLYASGRFEKVFRTGERGSIDEILADRSIEYIESTYRRDIEIHAESEAEFMITGRITDPEYFSSGSDRTAQGFSTIKDSLTRERIDIRIDFELVDTVDGAVICERTIEGSSASSPTLLGQTGMERMVKNSDFNSEEFTGSILGRAIFEALDSLEAEVVGFFPQIATVIAISGNDAIIDFGYESGAKEDMVFEVYRLEDITGSGGIVVWKDRILTGKIKIVEISRTTSRAIIISGEDFDEGDICVLSEEDESIG
ncbi:MAG: CsgG/HfaB family protein [bacterium]